MIPRDGETIYADGAVHKVTTSAPITRHGHLTRVVIIVRCTCGFRTEVRDRYEAATARRRHEAGR